MSRIDFQDVGAPIPTIALPPFGSDDYVPPVSFTFTESTDFLIGQYRALGFTHFEAWVVGAAGGRGGDSALQGMFIYEEVYRPVPQDVWNVYLNQMAGFDASLTPPKNFWNDYYQTVYIPGNPNYPVGGVPGADYGWPMTHHQVIEYNNPQHMMAFRTYKQVPLFPSAMGMGGGGGGGGMQKVSGLLTDLPDTVPVYVGKAGADASYGQIKQLGVWIPQWPEDYFYTPSALQNYLNSYPPPQSEHYNPQPGGDGGPSAFANTVARASGGKGGNPGMIWNGAKFVVNGYGGAGGIGGQTEPGGGGAGSTVEGANGSDGVWHPDIGIGGGGGGGKGGRQSEFTGDPRFGIQTEVKHLATAGGQGSYSFGDTSVYGQRQFRGPWIYQTPTKGYSMSPAPGPQGTYLISMPNGTVSYTTVTKADQLLIPGGGGGARPAKNLKYGSRAPGYSPDGVVVLRLVRIVDEPIGGGGDPG